MQTIEAPRSLCLLRLSALGDVTHVLPLLHTLREAWPDATISWVIGKAEQRLLYGLQGVRFDDHTPLKYGKPGWDNPFFIAYAPGVTLKP